MSQPGVQAGNKGVLPCPPILPWTHGGCPQEEASGDTGPRPGEGGPGAAAQGGCTKPGPQPARPVSAPLPAWHRALTALVLIDLFRQQLLEAWGRLPLHLLLLEDAAWLKITRITGLGPGGRWGLGAVGAGAGGESPEPDGGKRGQVGRGGDGLRAEVRAAPGGSAPELPGRGWGQTCARELRDGCPDALRPRPGHSTAPAA